MNDLALTVTLYGIPALAVLGYYTRSYKRKHLASERAHQIARESGLMEPASLHPVVDPTRCIGCGSCVSACPEHPLHHVLGLIRGKAHLVTPADCIGHGACKTACPVNAITLVFGTETRGLDIPLLKPNFETSQPGIFIAGELGGMGLIRNAIEQGRQAMDAIRTEIGKNSGFEHDVIVVGAGPSGFSATLAAKAHGLKYRTIEQDTLGGTVAHYPRGKLVMTAPVDLPLYGKVKFRDTSKEALLEFWQEVEAKTAVGIHYNERLEDIVPDGKGFKVTTTTGQYSTRAVLLAIGRRGTPRTLDVPGENQNKVTYRLIDPEQYKGKCVLVVGGGDSALEAALALSEQPGTRVSLSYRSESFSRAKQRNREAVENARKARRMLVLLGSQVKSIGEKHVFVHQGERELKIPNDAVIICAGGILPTPFLKKVGVQVETKFGTT
jgi:thioredoxin reductase/NAD-dependent dihydropyrimidine dehydrogenase PreA subunit